MPAVLSCSERTPRVNPLGCARQTRVGDRSADRENYESYRTGVGPSRRWRWRSTTSRQAPRASAAARTVAALVVALNLWLAAINWRAHAVRRGDGGGGGHGAVRSFFVCGTFWEYFFVAETLILHY